MCLQLKSICGWEGVLDPRPLSVRDDPARPPFPFVRTKKGDARFRGVPSYVLDTSLLLGGKEPPTDGAWSTTSAARAEIKDGGKDARRLEGWLTRGLIIRDATPESRMSVEEAARRAGNLSRLSFADLSLAALALETKSVLVTDDHTLLDVAMRLGVTTRTVNSTGIVATLDFRPRCTGCGRWFDAMPKRDECIVCGSPVKAKPYRPA